MNGNSIPVQEYNPFEVTGRHGINKPYQTRATDNYLENVSVQGNPVMLFAAIGEASTKFQPLGKNAAGQKGHQKFKYAPLHEVVASIKPALAEHKVAFMQLFHTMGDKQAISLIVSGHEAYVVSTFLFDMEKDPQEFGKISTYYRRYQLQAFFCLEGDKDLDDSDSEGIQVERTRTRSEGVNPNGNTEVKSQVVSRKPDVVSNAGQAVAKEQNTPKASPQKVAEKEQPKANEKEPSNEHKPDRASTPSGVSQKPGGAEQRSIGQKLMDAKKQLGWEMSDFNTFCKEHLDVFGEGFVAAEKLDAAGKQKLFDLLVKEKGVAPF